MITEMTINKECTILKIILTIYIAPASLKDPYLLPLQCNTLRRSNEYDRFTTTPCRSTFALFVAPLSRVKSISAGRFLLAIPDTVLICKLLFCRNNAAFNMLLVLVLLLSLDGGTVADLDETFSELNVWLAWTCWLPIGLKLFSNADTESSGKGNNLNCSILETLLLFFISSLEFVVWIVSKLGWDIYVTILAHSSSKRTWLIRTCDTFLSNMSITSWLFSSNVVSMKPAVRSTLHPIPSPKDNASLFFFIFGVNS